MVQGFLNNGQARETRASLNKTASLDISSADSSHGRSIKSPIRVTVTDEETQHQVELDFSTPSPPPATPDNHEKHHHHHHHQHQQHHHQHHHHHSQPVVLEETFRQRIRDSFDKRNIESEKPGKTVKEIGPVSKARQGTALEERNSAANKSARKSKSAGLVKQRVHFNSFSDSDEEDKKYLENIMRGRDSSQERPSWGFGNSRVPSRSDVRERERERDSSRNNSRAGSRAGSRSNSRTDLYSNTGLSYDDIVLTAGNSLMPTRKVSRQDSRVSMMSNISSKWKEDLKNYQAIKVTIYKNADQWFQGFEMRFKPNKDFQDLEAFMHKVSPKISFTTSVSYLFDTDGNRIRTMAELEDNQSYVASNTRRFTPANYGRTGEAFWMNGKKQQRNLQYRKRSGSSKSSSSEGKPGSGDGKVIKIVNNEDTSVSEKVLLNLRTAQTFEEVVRDLGQVLKLKGADKMYSLQGVEIQSFSQLRHEFQGEDVFIISSGPARISRSVSRISRPTSEPSRGKAQSRSSSRSRETGGESGAIKILINGSRRNLYAPANPPRDPGSPSGKLSLEWVYGYRATDQARNLWVLEKGELVYYVGAVAVVYNRMDEKQRHYRGHTEDISCMDLHPLGELMVSGQVGGNSADGGAHVRVWNVFSMETLAQLGLGSCAHSISGLSFSQLNKGAYISAVDCSEEKILHMWDWKNSDLLSKVSINAELINGINFHPFDNNLVITFGKEHLTFWNRKKDGFFSRADLAEATPGLIYQCLAFLESGDVVTGDNEGNLNSYSVSADGDYYRSFSVPAHTKGVSSILVLSQGTLLTSGSRDRRVTAWDSHREFVMIGETELPVAAGCGKNLYPQWPSRNDGNVYIGTSNNLILEGSLQRKFNMVLLGHTKPIAALSTHPTDSSFVTAGSDKLVAKWRRSKLQWKVTVQAVCLTVCHHPSGGVLAVGTTDGHMIVLTEDSGSHVTTIRMCGSSITALKFNIYGDLVAGASQNGSVYIYKVSRDGFAYKKFSKMSGGQMLSQLDWDSAGENIRTSSSDFSLTFWNSGTNKIEQVASVLRNQEWLDETCLVSWALAGAWGNHNYTNSANIETAHVESERQHLVTGDREGYLRLFGYPASSPKSKYHEEKDVSGPISCARFFYDGSYVIAVGGFEAALFKYKIK